MHEGIFPSCVHSGNETYYACCQRICITIADCFPCLPMETAIPCLNGQTITYDEIGNPLSYRNGMTMSWERGRSLFGITQGDNAISYTYDADGIRTSKTVNGATTTYILDGSTILGEKRSDGTTIRYLYDESGTPYAFFYNSQVYYYVYNAQGDVIEIMSTSGSDIATYKYDAWGNVIGIGGDESIAELNPIRYRGYYYDNETGFYYLNSRYYDPEIGRFINADALLNSTQSQLGVNLFTYCENDPINKVDHTGREARSAGISANITIFAGASIGIYWVWDDEGNKGLQWSYSHPFDEDLTNAGLVDIGIAGVFQRVDVDTIYDLEGISTAAGLSVGGKFYVTVDGIWTNPDSATPNGFQLAFGAGIGFDAHVNKSRTQGIWYNNPNPAAKKPTVNKPTVSYKRGDVSGGGGMRNRAMML